MNITNTIWFLKLAFLSFFYLSVINVRGRFLPNEKGGDDIVPPDGMCSTAAVATHGFQCQEYSVTTGDGYILSVQRIPEGRSGGDVRPRQPVLLHHGLLVDGMTWLKGSPEQSLAMMLADNGYDVWISNTRGTRFSRRHVSLDPIHPKFWDWTWGDLVSHELPSVIDFIHKKTGQRIHFAGHSMGTLIALVSLSEGKFKNVKSAALLSPIAYTSNITSPLLQAAAKSLFGEIGAIFGVAEFDPKGLEAADFIQSLCAIVECDDLVTALTGRNCCLNKTIFANFVKDDPQSTATKNLVHFSQSVRSGVLSKYDYGTHKNRQIYGAAQPPVYDLSKIPPDFPLFISYGGQDALTNIKDVDRLLDTLKSTHDKDKMQVQYIKEYAHVDFIMGVNAYDRVYNHIIDFFKKYV
ncbi:hypothetical protein OROGR_022488 [Orobanche gracilis]